MPIAAVLPPPHALIAPALPTTATVVAPASLGALAPAVTTTTPATTLVNLTLGPIDLNLLGLEVKTNQIQVTISAQPGPGNLLGNLLSDVGGLLNLQGVNNALNTVLNNVVTLLNSGTLSTIAATPHSPLTQPPSTTSTSTPILDLDVAPIHLNLLGLLVDTSEIHVQIIAHSGPGLLLGNLLTDVANLFNPPHNQPLNLNKINTALQGLLNQLNAAFPNIAPAAATPTTTTTGSTQILDLVVPPINLDLLGLILKTSQIEVKVGAQTGPGDLLGNLVDGLFKTAGVTSRNLTTLNNTLNAILAKVVGVLNTATLTLPSNAVSSLSQVLQQLALPDLINLTGAPATQQILDLTLAAPNNTPVNVNLLGLTVTTSNINVQLIAQTGQGQILGNLLYNVAHLLDPNSSLFTILGELGI